MSHRKVEQFKKDGPDKLIIVSDFDYTLTEYGGLITHQAFDPELKVTWQGQDGTLESFQNDLNIRFSALQKGAGHNEQNLHQVLHDWWSESHDILVHSNINRRLIEESTKYVKWREGAKTLLELCEEKKIPFFIVSAGIADVIREMVNKLMGHAHETMEIVGNQMIFDQADQVIAFGPVCHSLNKTTFLPAKFYQALQKSTNVLLLGDSVEDLTTLNEDFPGVQLTISVNPVKDTPGYDLQIKERDLTELVKLVKEICE